MPDGSATAHLLRPKLLTVKAEGYGLPSLRKNAAAGLTVAIVALPLSTAIGRGVGGLAGARSVRRHCRRLFLVSALGDSRYQVGGPAGA